MEVEPDSYHEQVLQIKTDIAVTLAQQKVPLAKVLGLVPGSMLIFQKHYGEPLTLEANGHQIAVGETVKVGDKFGIRILNLGKAVPS